MSYRLYWVHRAKHWRESSVQGWYCNSIVLSTAISLSRYIQYSDNKHVYIFLGWIINSSSRSLQVTEHLGFLHQSLYRAIYDDVTMIKQNSWLGLQLGIPVSPTVLYDGIWKYEILNGPQNAVTIHVWCYYFFSFFLPKKMFRKFPKRDLEKNDVSRESWYEKVSLYE